MKSLLSVVSSFKTFSPVDHICNIPNIPRPFNYGNHKTKDMQYGIKKRIFAKPIQSVSFGYST